MIFASLFIAMQITRRFFLVLFFVALPPLPARAETPAPSASPPVNGGAKFFSLTMTAPRAPSRVPVQLPPRATRQEAPPQAPDVLQARQILAIFSEE